MAGLHDRPRSGRPEKLATAQREELRVWVLAGPDPEVDGLSRYRLVDIAPTSRSVGGEDRSRIHTNPGVFARLRSFASNILKANQTNTLSHDRYRASLAGIGKFMWTA